MLPEVLVAVGDDDDPLMDDVEVYGVSLVVGQSIVEHLDATEAVLAESIGDVD